MTKDYRVTGGELVTGAVLIDPATGLPYAAGTGGGSSDATAANQVLGNTSLDNIDDKTPTLVGGRTPVDGSGVTQPVSAASLPLPTGASTAANQATGNTSLDSIDTKITTLNGLITTLSGYVDDAEVLIDTLTQELGVSSTPAATAGTDTAPHIAFLKFISTLLTPSNATGSITTLNANLVTGTATANSTVAISTARHASQAAIQVTGTWTGTMLVQTSVTGTTWDNCGYILRQTGAVLSSSGQISTGATGVFFANTGGAPYIRVTASAAMTGTAVTTIEASHATPMYSSPNPSLFNLNTIAFTSSSTSASPNVTGTAGYGKSVVAKASAGNLYGYTVDHTGAAEAFLMFFDSTTVPADTTVPSMPPIRLAANTSSFRPFTPPRKFATGISAAVSSTEATLTLIAGNDAWIEVYHA